MATGLTRIDIITTMELLLVDDTILDEGSPIKLSLEFPITFKGFRYDFSAFRSFEGFKNGEEPIDIKDVVQSGEYYLGDRLPQINIVAIYHMIAAQINEQFEESVVQVITETGEIE